MGVELAIKENEFHIDYLSATVKGNGARTDFAFLNAFNELSDPKPVRAVNGYNMGIQWAFGAMCLWHTEKPAMGTHFILSGKPLAALHNEGYDAVWLANRFTQSGANLTRIDLALDIYDSGLPKPDEMYYKFKNGEKKGRTRNASLIDRTDTGSTFYAGSWHSDRFYRYYNKAAEQGLKTDWMRLELVNKASYARSFQVYFAQNPTVSFAQSVFRGTIKAMANFDIEQWKAVLEGEAQKLSLPQHIGGKTREWILTQVASAITRVMVDENSDDIWNDLTVEVSRRIEEHNRKVANERGDDN